MGYGDNIKYEVDILIHVLTFIVPDNKKQENELLG
jgi:hypothetical protein